METKQSTSKIILWISYILQGLLVALFLMASFANITKSEMAVKGAVEMGYPESSVLYLGITLLCCTLLYALPATVIVGAGLLTAWLGGAVATHIIHHDPVVNTIMPVVFGILVWLAPWLRNTTLQRIFPIQK